MRLVYTRLSPATNAPENPPTLGGSNLQPGSQSLFQYLHFGASNEPLVSLSERPKILELKCWDHDPKKGNKTSSFSADRKHDFTCTC